MQWHSSGSQMIPRALQSQASGVMPMKGKRTANIKGSMSTQFNYNFGAKLINDQDDRFGYGFNDSDSDEDKKNIFQPFQTSVDSIKKFPPSYLNNPSDMQ